MVRPLMSALVWLAAVSSALAAADQPSKGIGGKTIANSFIIEGKSLQEVEALAKKIQEAGGKVLDNFPKDKDINALAAGFNVWPDEEIDLEIGPESEGQAELDQRYNSLGKRESINVTSTPWVNAMTQVDKMHAAGFKGEGIKVAIVDTGVDYTHEALGGCFGRGCRVAFGDNFSNDGTAGDTKDCAGHGTSVAGMVGGFSEATNYVGAAPKATLMAYRVLSCNHTDIIVSAFGNQNNWPRDPLSIAMARIAATGIPCFNAAGNAVRKGAFNLVSPGTGRGVISVGAFNEQFIGDNYASIGPTWDLDVKPSLGAPGVNVPSIEMNNTYSISRGTSFSAPIAAGIGALVAEALRKTALGNGTPKIGSLEIRSCLMSTAKPQKASRGSGLASVIQQGGGLIDAWDAAHTTTLVEPASLAFNDTEHRVSSLDLKITNTAKSNVTYKLSTLHVLTLNTVAETNKTNRDPMVAEPIENASANIKISQKTLNLSPGQSATVQVTAADPSGVDQARTPVWSGWIVVNGTDGSNLTVPFLGAAGSLRSLNTLYDALPEIKLPGPEPGDDPVRPNTTAFIFENPSERRLPGLPGSIAQKDAGQNVPSLLVTTYLPFGSPSLRFDTVPLSICSECPNSGSALDGNCMPGGNIAQYRGIESIGQPLGSPLSYVGRHTASTTISILWDGRYQPIRNAGPGQVRYAPPGRYQLAVHVLAHFGRAANPSDWKTSTSKEFSIAYEHNIEGKEAPSP